MGTDILLVTMPWASVDYPSIQLGTVRSLLANAGMSAEVRYYNLRWAEYAVAHAGLTLDELSTFFNAVGFNEWVFSVPPFREHEPGDVELEADIAREHKPEMKNWALRLRELVPSFVQQCLADLVASAPRVVGFTTSFGQNVPSLHLSKLLRAAAPDIQIVFGGANCDGEMGAALHRAFDWIDVVVRGEAERVVAPLFEDLLARRPVRELPGTCVREGGRSISRPFEHALVSMSEVPTPDYDDYFETVASSSLENELVPRQSIVYESARGCWWGEKNHCTFCGLNGTSMKFRSKSADRVYEEMVELATRHKLLRFQVVDNIIDMRYLRELLPRLRDTGWDWTLFYETKANLKKDQLRLFAQSGVRSIQPGIESLSTPILKLMRKGVTALQNIRLLKWCAELEIAPLWNLIMGFPGEPTQEYARMAELVPSLVHLPSPNWTRLDVDRFSPYHEAPAQHGLEIVGAARFYRLAYPDLETVALDQLAYMFEYRHTDGRRPESYAMPLIEVLRTWRELEPRNRRALRYVSGPGFIAIDDHRTTMDPAHYEFDEVEAAIYLACDAGATPAQVHDVLRTAGHTSFGVDDIREFLDGLVELKLVYREKNQYLGLAVANDAKRALRTGHLAHVPHAADEVTPALPGLVQLTTHR